MVQYTLRNRILHIVFWANFAITVVATLYFGWHYIADDLAGVVIALFSFWLGGLASGQKFDRHGLGVPPDLDHLAGARRRRLTLRPSGSIVTPLSNDALPLPIRGGRECLSLDPSESSSAP